MIRQFANLQDNEKELLLKAPALISVYESSSLNKINSTRKADAIKLAHLRTFAAFPILLPFYIEVEKDFKMQFETIAKQYTPLNQAARDELKKQIESVDPVLAKLEKEYSQTLRLSFNKFARHVQHADRSVLEYFVFPYPMPGL
jgi:hypothetical protein